MRRVAYVYGDPLLDWSDYFTPVEDEPQQSPLWPDDWHRWLVMDCAWSNEAITYDFLCVSELVGGRALLDDREVPIRWAGGSLHFRELT